MKKTTVYEVMKMASKILGANARRYQAITKNIVSSLKAKEFFLNVDPNFLTLADLDAQPLIDKFLWGVPYTFIDTTSVALDIGGFKW